MDRMSSIGGLLQKRWVLLGGFVLALAVFLWNSREQPLAPGSPVDFSFTLVPSDAQGLACASAQPLASERCGFSDEGAPAAVAHPLRPYTTTTGEAVLLAGVFEDPAIAKWAEQAGRTNNGDRVTVHCDATFLGRAPSAKVRWAIDGRFSGVEDVQVGKVDKCRVTSAP